jgi:hypothetical protein
VIGGDAQKLALCDILDSHSGTAEDMRLMKRNALRNYTSDEVYCMKQ